MSAVLDRVLEPDLASHDPAAAVRVRAMTAADAAALDEVFAGLSPRSRFLRYHVATPRLTARMRRVLLDIDGQRHRALVAEVDDTASGGPPPGVRAIGIGRLIALHGQSAEVAVEVVDDWQGRGVGTLLLRRLAAEATRGGYQEVVADVLPENRAMQRLLARVFPGAGPRGGGHLRFHDWATVSGR